MLKHLKKNIVKYCLPRPIFLVAIFLQSSRHDLLPSQQRGEQKSREREPLEPFTKERDTERGGRERERE